MKKIYIKTPEIILHSDFYREEFLPILQMEIENELRNPEWYRKYDEIAQEIFKTCLQKLEDRAKNGERIIEYFKS